MKKIFLFLIFFLNCLISFAQQKSIDIPLGFSKILKNHLLQEIEINDNTNYNLLAISILIEGTDVEKDIKSIIISWGNNIKNIESNHELSNEGNYVSNLLIIEDNNFDHFKIDINFDSLRSYDILNGHIRVFKIADFDLKKIPNLNLQNFFRSDSCHCNLPQYVSRTQWGIPFNLTEDIYVPPASYTDVTHLIIHHSAGANTSSNWANVVAAIFDYHVNTSGWQDIGYNWLIDPNGVLYEGRGGGDNVKGAHMCGHNENTMGVCMLGTYTSTLPTKKAMAKLAELLAWKSCQKNIAPLGQDSIASYSGFMMNISGHRDGCTPNYTECPGDQLYSYMDSIRYFVKDSLNHCISTNLNYELSPDDISIYPNPVTDHIFINTINLASIEKLEIYTVSGGKVHYFIKSDIAQNGDINLSFLPQGFYFLKLYCRNQSYIKKFVKI